MNNSPTRQHVDRALTEIQDWKAERKAENIRFYVGALTKGQLTIVPGKESTRNSARCDVCREMKRPGIRKFFYAAKTGFFWFHPCDDCWEEILQSADVHELAANQVNVS